MLYIEYATVERMRFEFLASQKQRPEQFTVCFTAFTICGLVYGWNKALVTKMEIQGRLLS